MIRPSVLWLAAAMAAPALWRAFVSQTLDVPSALLRFLIAVPIAAVLVAMFRFVVDNYRRQAEEDGEDVGDTEPTATPVGADAAASDVSAPSAASTTAAASVATSPASSATPPAP